jgi:hypothetical protein
MEDVVQFLLAGLATGDTAVRSGGVRYRRWNVFQLDLPMLVRVSYLLRQPSMHFYIQFVHNGGVVVGHIILCCFGAH